MDMPRLGKMTMRQGLKKIQKDIFIIFIRKRWGNGSAFSLCKMYGYAESRPTRRQRKRKGNWFAVYRQEVWTCRVQTKWKDRFAIYLCEEWICRVSARQTERIDSPLSEVWICRVSARRTVRIDSSLTCVKNGYAAYLCEVWIRRLPVWSMDMPRLGQLTGGEIRCFRSWCSSLRPAKQPCGSTW